MPGYADAGLRLLQRADQHEGDVQEKVLWQNQPRSVCKHWGITWGHVDLWRSCRAYMYILHICCFDQYSTFARYTYVAPHSDLDLSTLWIKML